ncbi:AMP-binding protein [Proteiniclasticum sp.]|uniref:AMP-binding protein n=1 Tax=Proteiniclasticum sp. TaxID=2053595 RepID=UPI00289ED612|nr:AMP-binding protein [Proteiniclasticum sp.]
MILEALIEQAKTDRICAVDEDGITMSFSELHARSDALATYFLETLSPKASVLLIGDKENDMLTCLFACMKSGRAYVPLTTSVPEKRADFIARDSDAELIIAFHTDLLYSTPLKRQSEKEIGIIIDKRLGNRVHKNHWLKYDEMLALLYTSGSTGTPKGVINCLGDLENLLTAPDIYYIGGPGMRVMNNFSYMFSAHMQHVYRTMTLMGSRMYAVPCEIQKDPGRLVDYYLKVKPDYLGVIATTCAMLLSDSRFSQESMPQLKGVALAGEVCSRKLIGELFDRFPQISVCIQYASTELTTVAVGNCITKEEFCSIKTDIIPLGRPVPAIEACLWDENGYEVKDGVKGELVILSRRLCDGYWKNTKETDAAFFHLPDGRRGFHTRDLMVRREGLLYYSGRLDNRIKIGGNRVELEEVESAVSSLDIVHQCVVRPMATEDGRVNALIAYITLKEETQDHLTTVITIKKALRENLPLYMIPQKIMILPEFKTNTSGKIDRAAIRMFHEEQMEKVYKRMNEASAVLAK